MLLCLRASSSAVRMYVSMHKESWKWENLCPQGQISRSGRNWWIFHIGIFCNHSLQWVNSWPAWSCHSLSSCFPGYVWKSPPQFRNLQNNHGSSIFSYSKYCLNQCFSFRLYIIPIHQEVRRLRNCSITASHPTHPTKDSLSSDRLLIHFQDSMLKACSLGQLLIQTISILVITNVNAETWGLGAHSLFGNYLRRHEERSEEKTEKVENPINFKLMSGLPWCANEFQSTGDCLRTH